MAAAGVEEGGSCHGGRRSGRAEFDSSAKAAGVIWDPLARKLFRIRGQTKPECIAFKTKGEVQQADPPTNKPNPEAAKRQHNNTTYLR